MVQLHLKGKAHGLTRIVQRLSRQHSASGCHAIRRGDYSRTVNVTVRPFWSLHWCQGLLSSFSLFGYPCYLFLGSPGPSHPVLGKLLLRLVTL